MQVEQSDIQTLKEAHRRSADRVRALLEELEVAELEFVRLTEKVRMMVEPALERRSSPGMPTATSSGR